MRLETALNGEILEWKHMNDKEEAPSKFKNLRIVISPRVLFQEVGAEGVLLDLTSETYFSLNTTGCRVWKGIEQCVELREVLDQLSKEYEGRYAEIERDVLSLVEDMAKSGLVVLESVDA